MYNPDVFFIPEEKKGNEMRNILVFLFIYTAFLWGRNLEILKNDRVLIVAPHPDDEILACAGVIQKCILNKSSVYVLYITDGENNKLSLLYSKNLLKPSTSNRFVLLGEIRKQESANACKILNLKKENLIFLDYPDGGIYRIFLKHWGKEAPYVDDTTGSYCLEKGEGITPLAPYKGESILSDIEKVLLKVKPTKIFLPTAFDDNSDHLATYLFCEVALAQLNGRVKPEKFFYLVHKSRISLLERYNPAWDKNVVDYFDKVYSNICIYSSLSKNQMEKKRKSISCFRSQMYCRKFLYSFVTDKETFISEIPPLHLKKSFTSADKLTDRKSETGEGEVMVRKNGNKFTIRYRIPLKEEDFRSSIFIFGLRKDRKFSEMPKIQAGIRGKAYQIYDKGHSISHKGTRYSFKNREVFLEIPLKIPGNPDKILFYCEVSYFFEKYSSIWRVIEVKQEN